MVRITTIVMSSGSNVLLAAATDCTVPILQVQILVQVRTGPKASAETTFEMLECELGTTVLSLKQQVTLLLSPWTLEMQPKRIAPDQEQNAASGAVQGAAGHGTCGERRMLCARGHALVSVVHLVSQKADFASRPMNHAETCCLPCRHRAE